MPVQSAPPPAAGLSMPVDLSAPEPETTPVVARVEMPEDTSPSIPAAPDAPFPPTVPSVTTPTAPTCTRLQPRRRCCCPRVMHYSVWEMWLPLHSFRSVLPMSATESRRCDWVKPTIRPFSSRFAGARRAAISQCPTRGIDAPATSGLMSRNSVATRGEQIKAVIGMNRSRPTLPHKSR